MASGRPERVEGPTGREETTPMWPFRSNRSRELPAGAPRWPARGTGTTRVLFEHPDDHVREIISDKLQERGYEVLTCSGPGTPGSGQLSCPLLQQERCPAVSGADVIVSGLPLREPIARLILRRTKRDARGRPVIVVASQREADAHGNGLIDHRVSPLTVSELTEALDSLAPAAP
jgi:hypothetical protein